jgi:hypothetical protein
MNRERGKNGWMEALISSLSTYIYKIKRQLNHHSITKADMYWKKKKDEDDDEVHHLLFLLHTLNVSFDYLSCVRTQHSSRHFDWLLHWEERETGTSRMKPTCASFNVITRVLLRRHHSIYTYNILKTITGYHRRD